MMAKQDHPVFAGRNLSVVPDPTRDLTVPVLPVEAGDCPVCGPVQAVDIKYLPSDTDHHHSLCPACVWGIRPVSLRWHTDSPISNESA